MTYLAYWLQALAYLLGGWLLVDLLVRAARRAERNRR